MIVVILTLIGTVAPCGDAPTRQEIQEAIVNSKHTMTNTCRPPSIYVYRGDLTPKQTYPNPMHGTVGTVTVVVTTVAGRPL
jgi:hypothetical protein